MDSEGSGISPSSSSTAISGVRQHTHDAHGRRVPAGAKNHQSVARPPDAACSPIAGGGRSDPSHRQNPAPAPPRSLLSTPTRSSGSPTVPGGVPCLSMSAPSSRPTRSVSAEGKLLALTDTAKSRRLSPVLQCSLPATPAGSTPRCRAATVCKHPGTRRLFSTVASSRSKDGQKLASQPKTQTASGVWLVCATVRPARVIADPLPAATHRLRFQFRQPAGSTYAEITSPKYGGRDHPANLCSARSSSAVRHAPGCRATEESSRPVRSCRRKAYRS